MLVLFLLLPLESDEAEVYLASLRDGKISNPVFLFKNDTAALYTPAGGGRILFVRNDNLYAQKLDLKARKVEGNPELVQQGVTSAVVLRSANVSVSESGTLIFRPGIAALSQVVTFDRNGARSGTTGPLLPANYIGLSPDETRLTAGSEAGSWLLEPDRPGRLSLGGRYLGRVWFPDSLRAIGVQGDQLLERSVVGPGEIHEIATVKEALNPQDVSPDGKFLLLDVLNRSLVTVRVDLPLAGRAAVPVAQTIGIQQARFSPDGHWLRYPLGPLLSATLLSANAGLFVQPFPGPGGRKQIANSGTFSYWRRDGKEIVYFDNGQIWSIRVDTAGAVLHFGAPKPLFKVVPPAGITTASKPLAISRDGSKIYFLQSVEQPEPDVIHVRTAAIR